MKQNYYSKQDNYIGATLIVVGVVAFIINEILHAI